MADTKKTKQTKKNIVSKEPPKKKISKAGKMANCYAGRMKEIGNVWDL